MSTTEKAPNYSEAQVAALIAASPVSYDDAVAFASEWGKTPRSVIAKVQTLADQGVEYIPKETPRKRPIKVTKAELVSAIGSHLDTDLTGLEKATMSALANLTKALQALTSNAESEAATE